jgi:CheY-like chemotaxis protein
MDLEMPEMDGLETTKQILIITKQSFIVGCTGYSNERGKCLQCGMTDVVEKPVSRKALKQLLKKLMSKENPKL